MIEGILEFFAEIIGEVIIGGLRRIIKLVGLFSLKILTWSDLAIKDIEEKYKGSPKPYFLGFGLLFIIIYLIFF